MKKKKRYFELLPKTGFRNSRRGFVAFSSATYFSLRTAHYLLISLAAWNALVKRLISGYLRGPNAKSLTAAILAFSLVQCFLMWYFLRSIGAYFWAVGWVLARDTNYLDGRKILIKMTTCLTLSRRNRRQINTQDCSSSSHVPPLCPCFISSASPYHCPCQGCWGSLEVTYLAEERLKCF